MSGKNAQNQVLSSYSLLQRAYLDSHGSNIITGDYSEGATGFLVENGELKHPINEITIAGNFKDMFQNITLANDLEFKFGLNAPTLRIDGMTVAGA